MLLILKTIEGDTAIEVQVSSLFLSDFNHTWIFSTDFGKTSNIKFHENPNHERRVIPCGKINGRTYGRTDRQTWWSLQSL